VEKFIGEVMVLVTKPFKLVDSVIKDNILIGTDRITPEIQHRDDVLFSIHVRLSMILWIYVIAI
jgi:hypothetical protein